jgi:hypothetical protein
LGEPQLIIGINDQLDIATFNVTAADLRREPINGYRSHRSGSRSKAAIVPVPRHVAEVPGADIPRRATGGSATGTNDSVQVTFAQQVICLLRRDIWASASVPINRYGDDVLVACSCAPPCASMSMTLGGEC